jgi:quercetin dioxygenase-like cupin family protein
MVRRNFLNAAGSTAFAFPAMIRARADSAPTDGQDLHMHIKRVGSTATRCGSPEHFTGKVLIDDLFKADDPARVAGVSVTFEPGARTAWHTHPLGQFLIVTAGCGRAQSRGGPIEEIRPGDVIWFPPGVEHWHGAAPTTAMTHIAIQEQREGKPAEGDKRYVDWKDKVTDAEYKASR